MIQRDGDERQLCCDNCGAESHVVGSDEFQNLVDDLKADKWKIRSTSAGWTHHCPNCEGDESALDRAKRMFGKS